MPSKNPKLPDKLENIVRDYFTNYNYVFSTRSEMNAEELSDSDLQHGLWDILANLQTIDNISEIEDCLELLPIPSRLTAIDIDNILIKSAIFLQHLSPNQVADTVCEFLSSYLLNPYDEWKSINQHVTEALWKKQGLLSSEDSVDDDTCDPSIREHDGVESNKPPSLAESFFTIGGQLEASITPLEPDYEGITKFTSSARARRACRQLPTTGPFVLYANANQVTTHLWEYPSRLSTDQNLSHLTLYSSESVAVILIGSADHKPIVSIQLLGQFSDPALRQAQELIYTAATIVSDVFFNSHPITSHRYDTETDSFIQSYTSTTKVLLGTALSSPSAFPKKSCAFRAQRALRCLISAGLNPKPTDCLLQNVKAMELLVADKANIADSVSRRLAVLCCGDRHDRPRFRKAVKKLYAIRSDIVHGNTSIGSKENEDLVEASTWSSVLISNALVNFSECTSAMHRLLELDEDRKVPWRDFEEQLTECFDSGTALPGVLYERSPVFHAEIGFEGDLNEIADRVWRYCPIGFGLATLG